MTARARRPFIIYRRNSGKKHGSYYAGFIDADTNTYRVRKALYDKAGQPVTNKSAAENIAREMACEVSLVVKGEQLGPYLSAFWRTDGRYAASALARGRHLSLKYLENMQSIVRVWLLPHLRHAKATETGISAVTPALIEDLMSRAQGKGASSRQVNAIRQAITVPLSDYWRLKGQPGKNPALAVAKFAERRLEREILTPDEARAFFALPWADKRLQTINLLAATTGMRLGECLGLLHEDLRGDWIAVCHNWQDGEGLKGPKGSTEARLRQRNVPIPRVTRKALADLVRENQYGGPFVFWGARDTVPIGKRLVEAGYNAALDKIGIKDAQRRRRGLTFHAWRHWYNSMLRGRVEDHALRALTGHSSEAMTQRYTEVTDAQRKAVRKVAEGLVVRQKVGAEKKPRAPLNGRKGKASGFRRTKP